MREEFSIKLIHKAQNRSCHYCGVEVSWVGGPELVVTRGRKDRAVCCDCGESRSPTLMALRSLGVMAIGFGVDFSDELEYLDRSSEGEDSGGGFPAIGRN